MLLLTTVAIAADVCTYGYTPKDVDSCFKQKFRQVCPIGLRIGSVAGSVAGPLADPPSRHWPSRDDSSLVRAEKFANIVKAAGIDRLPFVATDPATVHRAVLRAKSAEAARRQAQSLYELQLADKARDELPDELRRARLASVERARMQQLCSGEPLGSLQYASPSPHCGRCAVVGSAGSLLCQRYGAEIDGHGVVMRANAAPTGGTYSASVGSRTTIAVLQGKLWGKHGLVDKLCCEGGGEGRLQGRPTAAPTCMPRKPLPNAVVAGPNRREEHPWFLNGAHSCKRLNPRMALLELPQVVMEELHELKLRLVKLAPATLCANFQWTTGFMMAVHAALICRETALYGFVAPAGLPVPERTGACARSSPPYRYYSSEVPWWAAGPPSNASASEHVEWSAVRGGRDARNRHFFELEAAILRAWARSAASSSNATFRVRES